MDPFIQFGLVILVTLGVSLIMKILRQPLIIGYIIAGVIVGPFVLGLVHESEMLNIFAEMGIAFLLFIVGLYLSPKVIKQVGKISLVTGLGQIVFTSLIGFLLAMLFGFSWVIAMYIAIALTFSSTIIIIKLLSDRDALDKLYGKISIGFLLVQDLVAIVMLVVISSLAMGDGNSVGSVLLWTSLKGVGILAVLIPVSYYILPRLSDFFAKSQEVLFLFSIAWGFGLSLLFMSAGLSLEVGALIAGIMLSMSPYSHEIGAKLKPLRDFFIIAFFIILGSQMVFGDIQHLIIPAILLSLFVLIGNPFIVMTLMGLFGYSKKTGFMAGLTVAQISEFSLILIALGVRTGTLTQDILSFVTLIGLITIAGSTYMIIYADQIFEKIGGFLSIFERKGKVEKEIEKKTYKYILLGHNRIGFSVIKAFSKLCDDFLVVDYDPKIIKRLQKEGIDCIYGDVDNVDLLEELEVHKASVVVSTVQEKESGSLLLDIANRKKTERPIIILTAKQLEDAKELYKEGASYVILPHFVAGKEIAKIISSAKTNEEAYRQEKEKSLKLFGEAAA